MTYTEHGDDITLQMTREDYGTLMLALRYAAGSACIESDQNRFRQWVDFTNRLNVGNPNYTPYNLPTASITRE